MPDNNRMRRYGLNTTTATKRPSARMDDRRGATVIEVMFAMGVAVIGLMGIASLFPLAARNAADSNAQNNAITQGKIWENDFVSRGFNDTRSLSRSGSGFNWQWYNDVASTTPLIPTVGFLNVAKRGVVDGNGVLQPATPANSGTPLTTAGAAAVRVWPNQSFCLDPVFMSDPDVLQGIRQANTRALGFRSTVFPYYADWLNPVEDAAVAPAYAWHDQPRMLRVTLGGGAGQIPGMLVNDLFVSKDDLATTIDDTDKTIPPVRIFSEGGKSLTTGDYTWMVTASPEFGPNPLTVTNDYVVSLVIMQRRDRLYLGPNLAPVAGIAKSKPQGERLVWVRPLSGNFVGGTGGRVQIVSNADVEDRLHVGDWIMLSKWVGIDQVDPSIRYPVFRWYRIVAVDAESTYDSFTAATGLGTDPFNNSTALQEVWTRELVLEGPDWTFGDLVHRNFPSGYPAPTTGTLMKNVVTVIERTMTVR